MAERARTMLLAALVVGAGLLGFRHGERAVEVAADAATGASEAHAGVASTPAQPAAHELELLPLRDPTTKELLDAWPRLRAAAGGGRADAAFAIHRVSERCSSYSLRDAAGIAAPGADARAYQPKTGKSAVDAAGARAIVDEQAALRELCAKAGRLDAATHFGYLAQAVRGGHVPAIRVALAGPAPLGRLLETDRRAGIVRHAEPLAEIQRAVRFAVPRALAAGDRDVLFHYALALRGDGLLRADPDAAYAHMYASSLVPPQGYGPALYGGHLGEIAQYWRAERTAAARREGERIARTRFGWTP